MWRFVTEAFSCPVVEPVLGQGYMYMVVAISECLSGASDEAVFVSPICPRVNFFLDGNCVRFFIYDFLFQPSISVRYRAGSKI